MARGVRRGGASPWFQGPLAGTPTYVDPWCKVFVNKLRSASTINCFSQVIILGMIQIRISTIMELASKLTRMINSTVDLQGWLLNIENPVEEELVPALLQLGQLSGNLKPVFRVGFFLSGSDFFS